jgi:trehalose-6-phosphate synthase
VRPGAQDLADFVKSTGDRINTKYGDARTGYVPLVYEERVVPLHDRLALFSLAHCVVVTATRDGMNLVPYEYIVCRQGAPGLTERTSMLVVSGAPPARADAPLCRVRAPARLRCMRVCLPQPLE